MIKIILLLASVLEAECSICSLEEQQLVISTILNRVEDNRFPNTIEKVINQKRQFKKSSPSPNSILVAKDVYNGKGRDYKVLYFFKPSDPNKKFIIQRNIIYKKKYHYYAR